MARNEFAEAWQHLSRGELAAAQRLADSLLAQIPGDGRCLHLAGLVAHQQSNTAAALDRLARAAAQLPGDADVHAHLGVVLASAGRRTDAERHFRHALELRPDHADALYNLGSLCYGDGRIEEAVDRFAEAVKLRPAAVQAVFNWANALRDVGKLREAADAYERAIRLKPDYHKARNNLGNVYLRMGAAPRAIGVFEKALEVRPDYAEARVNLGNALRSTGLTDKAIEQFRQAIVINVALPKAHAALGDLLKERHQIDKAVGHYRKAIEHYVPLPSREERSAGASYGPKPNVAANEFDLIRVWNNMGSCLVSQREFAEAEASFRYVLSLDEKNAVARNNLGVIRMVQGLLGEATQEFKAALAINDRYAEAHSNLGAVLQNEGRNEEAAAAYEQALELDDTLGDAHWNRSLLWLAAGDWDRGWPEYEWRWRRPDFCRQQFRCPPNSHVASKAPAGVRKPQQAEIPAWDGSPLDGKAVLLFTEQGLGDVIQFVRLTSLVKSRGGRVVVEAPPRLMPLLRSCEGVDQLIAQGDDLPRCEFQLPLMSLPATLGLTEEALSRQGAYLSADAKLVSQWHKALSEVPGLKVGINWQGNPTYQMDRFRSVPLAEFAPLARLPDVTLIALQQGFGCEQIVEVQDQFEVHTFGHELDRDGAFLDTAAIMANLDLIVTSDTAMAHLAGALGVPTWVVLPAVADWRWGLSGEECSWYPNMRLFRQQNLGEWRAVFQRVTASLDQQSRRS